MQRNVTETDLFYMVEVIWYTCRFKFQYSNFYSITQNYVTFYLKVVLTTSKIYFPFPLVYVYVVFAIPPNAAKRLFTS